MIPNLFSGIPDDVVLNIFFKLEEDPRNWARLACVCTKFSSLIRNICWKSKCYNALPAVISDFLSTPGDWAALYKLLVCCPGLLHSGVLLDNSDFGLDLELGPDENYQTLRPSRGLDHVPDPPSSSNPEGCPAGSDCSWSLFDDLYFDTVYNPSDCVDDAENDVGEMEEEKAVDEGGGKFLITKKRRDSRSMRSHLASGVWNLSREQGNKLLASRFRGDCLYMCEWPGCVHMEEKRNYMVFRGVFMNFKRSRVWRTINEGRRRKIDVNCAFCSCKETWDLHSAFCLRRVFGYHDDGEPVVRAYVCENGHVAGAWTDWPLYN